MAVFTITSFASFAGLLLAGQKLATAPDPINWLKALADLATNGKALAAVLTESGLSPLAQEMAAQAEDHARHFTHPGPARDDAIAIFWQVAPAAISDPAVFTAGDLDPDRITERMVVAIRSSPLARDFAATPLPEQFFRSVTRQTLAVMLGKADYIATITPDLWRETLRRHGVEIGLLTAIDATTRYTAAEVAELNTRVAALTTMLAQSEEARAARAGGVSERALIQLVRPIAENVEDTGQALIELTRAVEIAKRVQEEGRRGSNLGEFVDEVLRRTAAFSGRGEHRAAISALDTALVAEEAGSRARQIRLLERATDELILARDARGAAERVARRVALETPDPETHFDALRREQDVWYARGRDKGLNFDLEISIELARVGEARARDADERGVAMNDLGAALRALGERESGTARLEAAVAAFRAALEEMNRDRVPLDWAVTQMNLGTAFLALGDRESGTARLEAAVAAFRAALEEMTRDRAPLDWAMTQNNLGSALGTLGVRESGTARLKEAVAAFRAALEERTRDRVPLDWATTQMNLGAALAALGQRETGTARLEEAVAAYRAALEERTRDRVPLQWAMTQNNLGSTLGMLGERESGTARLEQAVAACSAALEEMTRDRVPLHWAGTQTNLGNALAWLGERESGTARLEAAVEAFPAALEELTRDRVPLRWANATGSQGSALLLLSERTSSLAGARAALSQLREGAAALRDGGHIPWAETFERQIPRAEALVARLEGG